MSHATVAMSPAVQSLLTTMMPAVAVGAAGFAVTAGAIAAARKLRCDFETAKVEFEDRCLQDEVADMAVANQQAMMAMTVSAFGASIEASSLNTTQAFIERSLGDLIARAEEQGLEEVSRKASELISQAKSDSSAEVLQAYFALCDQVDSVPSANRNQSAFDALKAEISLFAASSAGQERLHAQLNEQLAKLEAVGDRSSAVALQGVDNLKARVRREIAGRAERDALAVAERHQKKAAVAEAYAMIRAIMQSSDDLSEQSQAEALLNQLGAAFQKGAPPTVSELEALLAKARSLFTKCEKRLEETAAHAYVADSVKDVLLNLGYQVSEVPSEIATRDPGCMVSLDGDSGVVVSVAPDGRMLTEMVAFNSNGLDPDEVAEKKVCQVVDLILEGLKKRDIEMQERSRKKLRPGHRLRMVKKAKAQELTAATQTKARSAE